MRLDKYLKVSRLIKRRTVANEACDNGRISVNGRVVKASYEVKVGDKIEVVSGVFAGYSGVLQEISEDQKQLTVLVSTERRDISVMIEVQDARLAK